MAVVTTQEREVAPAVPAVVERTHTLEGLTDRELAFLQVVVGRANNAACGLVESDLYTVLSNAVSSHRLDATAADVRTGLRDWQKRTGYGRDF